MPLWPKPELPDGTAVSLVWRSGNALSAIFTRVTSATCGSRIIASIRSSGEEGSPSFAARAAIAGSGQKPSFCWASLSDDHRGALRVWILALLFLCYSAPTGVAPYLLVFPVLSIFIASLGYQFVIEVFYF